MNMPAARPQILFLSFVLLLLIGFNVIGLHHFLTAPYPGHNDFMSRWEGARSFWVDGLNPYGEEASLNIQERIYGRAAQIDEDPGYFAYPFYTAFVVLPLVFTDYAWASAVWMVVLEACLIGACVLLINLFRWRPPPLLLALVLIWTLVDYFGSRGLLLGQPGLLVYFLEVLTIWGLWRGNAQGDARTDILAGIALAVSTLKPQMGYLFVPFLLLWSIRYRRGRFMAAFIGTMGGLLGVSFLLQPSWLSDWLRQVNNYSSYTALGSPVWIVTQYYLGLGVIGEWALSVPLYGLMLWAWYSVLMQGKQERLLWVMVLTLTITHLVAPRTATPHYVVFTIPLLFYFRTLAHRDRRYGHLWVISILLLMTVLTWVHALTTVVNKFEHPTVYLPLPFTMLILLWLTRRLWWSFTPDAKDRAV
jgi:hypothetical protein